MGLFDFLKKRDFEASEIPVQKQGLSMQEAEVISREFGKFLAEKKLPVIWDANLLPHPKERIMEALNISIKRFRNLTDPEALQMVNALEFCMHGLSVFAEIDPQDREAVAYFNQLSNAKAVPEERKEECLHLMTKYMKRGRGMGAE